MRLTVYGRTGQVATELARLGHPGTGREAVDFADPGAVAAHARAAETDGFVNAAAYTAVDRAEEEVALSYRINAESVGALARVAAERGLPLVHISTDYVFDGSGDAPRAEDAPTAPLGAYGRTKLAGEAAIRAAGPRHVILRTSWVFSAHGQNFVKTMLRLSQSRDRLTIVADQVGGPTPAAAIARACTAAARALADGAPGGTYHFAGAPDVSWAEFARAVFAGAGRGVEVMDIPTADYPTPAARPLNSRLDCTAIARDLGVPRPDWPEGLAAVLAELEATA